MSTKQRLRRRAGAILAVGLSAGWTVHALLRHSGVAHAQAQTREQIIGAREASLSGPEQPPTFQLDTSWPRQPLPNNWGLGIVWAVKVDSRDHVWVLHQTAGEYSEQIKKAGKVPAPAVLEFDPQGNFVEAWGEPGQGGWTQGKERRFPAQSMAIDWKGNIWVADEARGHAVVKFSREGKYLLQIGEMEKTNGNSDTKLLGGPSGMDFDPAANEIYIADGYVGNQRVIVFDADTGVYKRHWGRYGLKPDENFETGQQPMWMTPSPFLIGKSNPVGNYPRFAHGVNLSRDGFVYVTDRAHSIIYVHRKDGAYVKEGPTPGPVNSVAFSSDPSQRYVYATGINASARMYILRRSDLHALGSFKSDGQHYIATDSKGNLFTCGLFMPQRWVLKNPRR
jgi:hypothetical protein